MAGMDPFAPDCDRQAVLDSLATVARGTATEAMLAGLLRATIQKVWQIEDDLARQAEYEREQAEYD